MNIIETNKYKDFYLKLYNYINLYHVSKNYIKLAIEKLKYSLLKN